MTIAPASPRTTNRQMPWDVMGDKLNVTDAPLENVLAEAGLDYELRFANVAAYEQNNADEPLALADFIEAPKFRAVIRPMPDNSLRTLGVVGGRYSIIQNSDAFALADPLRDLGATIIGAADYRGGGASMLAVRMPDGIRVTNPKGGSDLTDLNLIMTNPHDGSGSATFALTPLRLACTNALTSTIRAAEHVWRVRHTSSALTRIEAAQRMIMEASGYAREFEGIAQRMAETRMTRKEFEKIIAREWARPNGDATERVMRTWQDRHDLLVGLFEGSETLTGFHGTAWGAYNAITEYVDHMRPVRGENPELTRAESTLSGGGVLVKDRAFTAIRDLSFA